jgi:hypothetical protein
MACSKEQLEERIRKYGEIRELLQQGLSRRQITAQLGVGKHYVSRVCKEIENDMNPRGILCPFLIAKFAQRCPGCGGKVIMPCHKCEIDSLRAG